MDVAKDVYESMDTQVGNLSITRVLVATNIEWQMSINQHREITGLHIVPEVRLRDPHPLHRPPWH